MDITMVGIDYRDAGLDIRGKFSYTKREQEETIMHLKQLEGISGCVLLSTCNRTELVLSYTEEWDQDEKKLFCGLKALEPEQYAQYLHIRQGMEAVQDLFEAILTLETEEECFNFFEDVCTVNELLSIAQRFAVAKMLKEDNTYLEVAEKTGASTATISRVNTSHNYGKDGYALVISRMKSFQQNDKQSNEKTDK